MMPDQLAERDRAHDERQGLRAADSSLPRNDGEERGEYYHLGERRFEQRTRWPPLETSCPG